MQRVTYNEYTVDEVVPTEIEEIPTSLFYRKQSKVMTLEEGHDGQDTVVLPREVDRRRVGRDE